MVGELIEYDDENYILQTQVGLLTVQRSLVDCEGASCPKSSARTADLVVRGSDTVGEELFPLLVEGYANTLQATVAERLNVAADTTQLVVREDFGRGDELMLVEVQSAGSSTGLRALIEENTDIAMSSRPARASEIRDIEGQGRGDISSLDQEYVIAVDSILVVVSPDNPVEDLTIDQVAGLFSGSIANWSEVGGPDLPVTVVTRPEASGTRAVFEGQIFASPDQSMSSDATTLSSNEEVSEFVAAEPGAIGYIGFAAVRDTKPVGLILNCGIRTKATEFAAKTEEYPLERRLRLYVDNDERSPDLQDFLDFTISADADGLIEKAGFINLGVKVDTEALDGAAMTEAALETQDVAIVRATSDLLTELEGAARLSTTFRFASGSSRLDNKAERDIVRVIDYLANNARPDNEIIVVGFTDADGNFSANERLSRSRAGVVLDAIRSHPNAGRLSDLQIRATGYGELSPVGCNDTFQGRQRNRRVEVWLR